MSEMMISRRKVIGAIGGAAALAGLPGCGSSGSAAEPPIESTAKIIDGYTDRQSYSPGDSVTLYLNTDLSQRTYVHIYDYAGRPVHSVLADVFPQQPVGPEPWATGFGYQPTVTFDMPALASGVYLVGDSPIPLIVKNPVASGVSSPTDMVIVYPTNTIAAYNDIGGLSMYSAPTKATVVSFLRPAGEGSNVAFFSAFLGWFADIEPPASASYIADIDLENYAEIAGAKLLVLIGHSEYWTRAARENFDRFVMAGGNALVLSGNTMWWQVRYSADQTQMICYKNMPDPIGNPLLETINWTQPSLQYPTMLSTGADYPHGGYGIGYPTQGGFKILNPDSPIFKGVSVFGKPVLGISTVEHDGAPLLNDPVTDGVPRLDLAKLGAYKAEIIGYDACSHSESKQVADSVATWIVYQRTAASGIVINGASTNWCSYRGAGGPDGFRVRQVIVNMMNILVNKLPVFSS